MTTLRVTLPECTPTPSNFEITVFINGALLFTSNVGGDLPHYDFQAAYYPSSTYTATAKPIYNPISCSVGAV